MTPAQMMANASALLNDQDREVYTNTVLLAYYNMSLQKLQEVYELNNIPATNETSISLNVAAGVNRIAFTGTVPQLPGDLIDIRQLWESQEGQELWTPMTRKTFLPHYLQDDQRINQFLVYAWEGQEIKLIAANADNDLKIDYIKAMFSPISLLQINTPVEIINVQGFLTEWTAGLAADFIGENPERAEKLYALATQSLDRATGINVKGMQQIPVRRRPYRQSYKQRSVW